MRVLAALSVLLLLGCYSEETKLCRSRFAEAQEIVLKVDSKSLDSVEKAHTSVVEAADACTKAGRNDEVEQLRKARNELSGHLDYMKKKAGRPKRKAHTPEELAQLEKTGDPECPKGQAYRPDGKGKEIRCTGPQIADMTWKAVQDYFSARGFKMSSEGATLKAEYGAELYFYTYEKPNDDRAPKCVVLYPAPGIPWQEAASRATGARPDRLEKGGTVGVARGKVPLQVDDDPAKVIVKIGDCGS